jgi:squalene-hopene/tetraprenyl-beta-curcumene cyclase
MMILRSILAAVLAALLADSVGRAEDGEIRWKKEQAATYLDEREKVWFEFPGAARGERETKTACISCHTVFPYALARPVLRRLSSSAGPSEYEQKLLTQIKMRVDHWKELDTSKYGLPYDFSEQKKKESWGTEAVLNSVILAHDDQYQGLAAPNEATKQALQNLWKVQVRIGRDKGSWDWLNFGLEPWESPGGRYYGASLAAIAVGTAPDYYRPGTNPALDAQVQLLRGYLKDQLADQNLFNRTWALWASTKLDGVLTADQQKATIGQLLSKQGTEGGWSLSSLGTFARKDGTAQETASDGYATGLVLHVLQLAGMPKDNVKIAKGLAWLRANQQATGEWRGYSMNKKRDPSTHVGKFMTDAATAYAVLALSH